MTTATATWDTLALLRKAEEVRAQVPALAGGWRGSAGAVVVLVHVQSDRPGGIGPTWYWTAKGHLWASPRWGSYRRAIQANAARSLAVLDVLTHGAVLPEAARAGVAQGVLEAAREIRAQLAQELLTKQGGSPTQEQTSPWVCALAARSDEVNTQTVQGSC